ncbi:uncharacterized protein LOC101174650 isoform X3 [Oryzias latipes]|uniref:uncharacterized protein LOC101174650 isoform X3 n=1 Tax=Oryzias latipes TaxID=8090 RepID=UPI0005CBF7D3|nr:uncharacterized protein LOC101174650 isoform X3 [Oryzias latipes]
MARRDAGLLLLLSLCFDSDVTLVKTARGDPGVTPVCSGAALQDITLIVCQIRTRWRREDCRVLYRHQQNFSSECGSGFRLVTENQTLFLQAEDGRNHTSDAEEGGVMSDLSMLGFTTAVSSASGLVMVAAALLGLVLRNAALRAQRQAELQRPPSKGDDDSTYASLQQPTDDLYQTIDRRDPAPRVTRVTWVIQETEIYENP